MKRPLIIVTTDKEPIGKRIAAELTGETCEVVVRDTPTGCSELLQGGTGDVLILDLLMNNFAGMGLFQSCREHWRSLPIITFTHNSVGVAKATLVQPDSNTYWPAELVNLTHLLENVRGCLKRA